MLNIFAFAKTFYRKFITFFRKLVISRIYFVHSEKRDRRDLEQRLSTILYPASPAQNNSRWSRDAGYPWSLLTVLPRPPPCLQRDFSIVFSPPHTVYGCARVLCITCRAYMYNLHIPIASCTYTGWNTRAMRVAPRFARMYVPRFPCRIRYDRLNFVSPTTGKSVVDPE